MDIPNLPGPVNDDVEHGPERPSHSGEQARGGRHSRDWTRRATPIQTEEQCVVALQHLMQMLLLGMVTTSQANACRTILREIIGHHRQQRTGTQGAPVPQAELRRMAREFPGLLSALESFLSEEQIAELLRDPGAGDD